MTPLQMRTLLVVCAVLGGAVTLNVMVLQPVGGRSFSDLGPDQVSRARSEASNRASPTVTVKAKETLANETSIAPDAKLTKAVQRELASRGYETGPVNGVPGVLTRAAIMAYEHDQGLAVSAEPTEPLLERLLLGGRGGTAPATAIDRDAPLKHENARRVTELVEQSLMRMGYEVGQSKGQVTAVLERAIRDFERRNKLRETGRISGELIAKLSAQGRVALIP